MATTSSFFNQLNKRYIFPVIEEKLSQTKRKYPNQEILNLGVGDINHTLEPSIAKAICNAGNEMEQNVIGYGSSLGLDDLRKEIENVYYNDLSITKDEIFISDGINSDITNILDLFAPNSKLAIITPAYPVYLDNAIISGRITPNEDGSFDNLLFIECSEENNFSPHPPNEKVDIIYLCSPQNPCGTAIKKTALKLWVDYAIKHKAIILFDAAYEAFIRSSDVAHSIYEIERARNVAIEFRSLSKSAGFSGLRLGYTIIPHSLHLPLNSLWTTRLEIKSNGVSFPIQKAAIAALMPNSMEKQRLQIDKYLSYTKKIKTTLKNHGQIVYGGDDSIYLWWKIPEGYTDWDFFDLLLNKLYLIAIPGSGFGKGGSDFVRLSCFINEETCNTLLMRLTKFLPTLKSEEALCTTN